MTNLRSLANESLGWMIGTGILLVIVGAFAVYAPFTAGLAADTTIAVLLMIGGIAHFVLAWQLRGIGGSLWEVLVGIAYILGGLVLFAYPVAGLVTLTLILGIYLFFSALTELAAYFGLRFLRGSGWFLFNGIITLILAIMVLRHLPVSAVWVPGTLVGFSMITSGVTRLSIALAAKRASSELAA
ncbi:MAG: DUF308 domain-containing protein [Edaphobacter sp.]